MGVMRYRWLKLWGYKPYRLVRVAHSWDGETPPMFGYYTKLIMNKGASTKVVKFKDVATTEDLRELLREEEGET